jgi:hypothetical protein
VDGKITEISDNTVRYCGEFFEYESKAKHDSKIIISLFKLTTKEVYLGKFERYLQPNEKK